MKKRMKQMLALGLAVMLVLGGCAEEPKEPVIEETPQVEETVETEEQEIVEEEPIAELTDTETVLKVNVDKNQKTYYLENSELAYLYLEYCDVKVSGGLNENLKKNIENWSMEQNEEFRSEAVSLETDAAEAMNNAGEELWQYTISQNVETARIDGSVVSLIEDTYHYMGGAHGTLIREGINFDVKNGKRIDFQELFSDYENFKSYATDRIIYQLQENYEDQLFEDYVETIESMWLNDLGPSWYFDASGMVIVLEQYMVGPYSLGIPEIYLPYVEIRQYIKEAYMPDTADSVARFRQNQEVCLTLPESEEEIAIMLRSELKDDMMYNSLWLGSSKVQLQDYVIVMGAHVIRNSGELYCLIVVDEASDDYKTYIFRLTEGKLEKVDELYAAIDDSNINIEEIRVRETVYLLGTYGGEKTYFFDENGQFVTEDSEFALSQNEFVLTTKADIPVTLEGTESVLPSGSHIILTATDDETYVKFTIQETGQEGMMMVERNENDYYQITVGGMNENDCFELLPYAG